MAGINGANTGSEKITETRVWIITMSYYFPTGKLKCLNWLLKD